MERERKVAESRKKGKNHLSKPRVFLYTAPNCVGIKVNSLDESLLNEDTTLLQMLNVDAIVEKDENKFHSGSQRFKSKWPALSLNNNKLSSGSNYRFLSGILLNNSNVLRFSVSNTSVKANCGGASNKPVRKKMKTQLSQQALDSGMILEDSFEFSEDTQTLINKNVASKVQKELVNSDSFKVVQTSSASICKRTEEDEVFDAFQNFVEKKLKPKKQCKQNNENINLDLQGPEVKESQISQYCNVTQVMRQIDNIISYSDQLSTSTHDASHSATESKNVSLEKAVISQDTDWNETFNDGPLLKSKEYKKEVEMLFDRLETTICEFGMKPEQNPKETTSNRTEPNKLLKSIIEIIKSPTESFAIANNEIDWNDDTFLTNTVLNLTQNEKFSDIIKKALLENASKVPNQSMTTKEARPVNKFKKLGEFYGLPNKVKDLIKLYKGIDKLYGMFG